MCQTVSAKHQNALFDKTKEKQKLTVIFASLKNTKERQMSARAEELSSSANYLPNATESLLFAFSMTLFCKTIHPVHR